MTYTLTLNGQTRNVDAGGDTPILYILRDQLRTLSPRYGCGAEQCGACRILVDGELTYSCTTTLIDVADRHVTTVEGMAPDNSQHALQKAFLSLNAAQCGYCLSGIMISAFSLLQKNNAPSREEIQAALVGHLCRCGAHNRIISAIKLAAAMLRSETGPSS